MNEAINQLKYYIESKDVSQNKVANAIGVSAATISGILKGTYEGNNESVIEKIKDFLATEAYREAAKSNDVTVKTKNFNTIHRFCNLVLTHRVMGMLTGEAGIGKTRALQAYAEAHPTCIMIEADHGYTAKVFFEELCELLNLDKRGSLHDKLERVVKKLEGSGRLIIIDEAEHLPYRAIELIRRVYDKAHVGIALCGMPRLEKNVQGDKEHYAQIYSRISAPCRAKLLDNADIKAYLESRFEKIAAGVVELCAGISRRNFRLLSHLALWSRVVMQNNNIPELSEEVVKTASQMLVVAQ